MTRAAAVALFVATLPGIGKVYALERVQQVPPSCSVERASVRATFAGGAAPALCKQLVQSGWSTTQPHSTRSAACIVRSTSDLAEVDGSGTAARSACAQLVRERTWVNDPPALRAKRAGRPLPLTVRVPSSSMEPTLRCARPAPGCSARISDLVVIARGAVRRGDIVLFRTPPRAATVCGVSGFFLKRVIGLPGETVAERNGYVSIDGRRLPEPYLSAGRRDHLPAHTWHVAKGSYFLLGDNRALSCDSRVWGSVPAHDVVGREQAVLRFR